MTARPAFAPASLAALEAHDEFLGRHIGPNEAEMAAMLAAIGQPSLEALTAARSEELV